jgi:hypothetical protein
MTTEGVPAPFAFFRLATSYQISQAIYVAAKLGIADLLADRPKTTDELSRATGAHAATLQLLLDALSTIDIFNAQISRFACNRIGGKMVLQPATWRHNLV